MLGCVLHDLCFVWPNKSHNINLHIFVTLCDRPIDQAMLTWTEDRITVIINAVYLPGGRVLSHVPGIRLREYLSSLPPPKVAVGRVAARGADAVRAPPSDRARFLADHPWAMEHLDVGRDILGRKRRSFEGGDDAEGSDVDSVHEEEAEDMASSIFAAMEDARGEAADGAVEHFKVRPLGGVWTQAHLGVAQDAWQGLRIVALSETLHGGLKRHFQHTSKSHIA
jgi:hypothetical protein